MVSTTNLLTGEDVQLVIRFTDNRRMSTDFNSDDTHLFYILEDYSVFILLALSIVWLSMIFREHNFNHFCLGCGFQLFRRKSHTASLLSCFVSKRR